MPRILPSGTGMLPPSSIQETSGLRGLGRACIPTPVDAIVQELEEGEDYAPKRPPSAGRDLLSVQLHHPSSEPQVVTAQLVDGPAAHQLHVAFDFSSEIFKRPFHAGLTRGRQSIQIKSPSRTRLRAHGKGLQDVGATGDAAVTNYIYSLADSIDNFGELVKGAPRAVQLSPP